MVKKENKTESGFKILAWKMLAWAVLVLFIGAIGLLIFGVGYLLYSWMTRYSPYECHECICGEIRCDDMGHCDIGNTFVDPDCERQEDSYRAAHYYDNYDIPER